MSLSINCPPRSRPGGLPGLRLVYGAIRILGDCFFLRADSTGTADTSFLGSGDGARAPGRQE